MVKKGHSKNQRKSESIFFCKCGHTRRLSDGYCHNRRLTDGELVKKVIQKTKEKLKGRAGTIHFLTGLALVSQKQDLERVEQCSSQQSE